MRLQLLAFLMTLLLVAQVAAVVDHLVSNNQSAVSYNRQEQQ